MSTILKDVTWVSGARGTLGIGTVEVNGELQLRASIVSGYVSKEDKQTIADWGGRVDVFALEKMIKEVKIANGL